MRYVKPWLKEGVHCKECSLNAPQRDYMQLRYTENGLSSPKCPTRVLRQGNATTTQNLKLSGFE